MLEKARIKAIKTLIIVASSRIKLRSSSISLCNRCKSNSSNSSTTLKPKLLLSQNLAKIQALTASMAKEKSKKTLKLRMEARDRTKIRVKSLLKSNNNSKLRVNQANLSLKEIPIRIKDLETIRMDKINKSQRT